jgi:hypothetical protein
MKRSLILYSLCSALFLSACSNDDDTTDNDPIDSAVVGVAVGTTSDYTTASHAIIATESPYNALTELLADDNTDIVISHYGTSFYKINRGGASIIKFDIANRETPVWECSTDTSSNPHQMIQVSDTKAYVLRYGSGALWIVDPSITDSSQCDTDFKTGEIDLSAFDDDGVPEMTQGLVVDNYLFVVMQRLESFAPTESGLVAVIDITTDTLVDVDDTEVGTQAITLPGRNPSTIQYLASNDTLYVQSVGKYDATSYGGTPAEYTGGIDTINPTTFEAIQLVDDTMSTTQQISGMAVVSDTVGYLVNYAGWQDNTLYQFNPTTGVITTDTSGTNLAPVASMANQNISGVYAGPAGSLWLGVYSGFTILDTSDNSVIETLIDTKMNPTGLVFINRE